MDVDVETTIEIERPVDEVAVYAADPTNAPEWYTKIESVEWETEPPVAVGSRMAFVAHFLGRRLAYTYAVTAFEPGNHLVMATTQGPFPMQTTYTWRTTDAGTEMTLRNTGVPSGFSRLLKPLMVPAIRRANRKDLDRLKFLLESATDE